MKNPIHPFSLLGLLLFGGFGLVGCGPGSGGGSGGGASGSGAGGLVTAGKFTILGVLTDQTDFTVAKKNAENTLRKHPGVNGLVGLWAYNAPLCLDAVKDAGRAGEIKIFAFDEDDATLQGIIDGHVEGTIVQQPYEFGYQSVRYLKMIHDGEAIDVPEDKLIDIPAKRITRESARAFWDELKELAEIGAKAAGGTKPEGGVRFAFVTNNSSSFWSYARAGCYKAEKDFGVVCDFESPHDGSTTAQNRILTNIINRGGYAGVAVSVNIPADQADILNQLADAMPLICHDSDAPDSKRRFYLGTNNYAAGRLLGEMIKESLPDGGKLMVFVGKIDALNARQRYQGMLDELGGAPDPAS